MTPTALPAASGASRRVAMLAAAAVCATGLAVVSAAVAPDAGAKAKPRNPISSMVRVAAATDGSGGITFRGWVADPDSFATNVHVSAVLDGKKTIGDTDTSLPNVGAVQKFGTGATPGYSLAVTVPTGKHVVCVVFRNVGGGLSVVKKCVTTPLGRKLTSSQRAKRSPKGAIQSATAAGKAIRLVGWATDPDLVTRSSQIVTYVNGRSVATRTTATYPGARPAGAGKRSRFDITLPVARATQIACLYAVNIGFGKNTFLGCKALDPRGSVAESAAAPATPALNAKVVKLAKKQIGKPYVWAAAGPKSFDCSGLVTWAYRKYGFQTPRVSQDQIKSARLIPASRAVPGDLVFYHDETGDVYHVGIYLKPGVSVAAIDTDQGVNYQQIWDPSATYGSFTHV